VLSRLLVFPRMTGVRRFPITLLGVLGSVGLLQLAPRLGWPLASTLAVLWMVLPPSQLPWVPWRVRLRIGTAIPHADLFPDDGEATLVAACDRVRGAVEDLVNLRDREKAGAT